ncbi:50S ribosomal protein L10 [Thermoplasmatales archaeon ex4572_165]|nr:MAG: 50S ribosomal protein L10 [Thermoplasmatales archaeon ex4572_165]RLF58157.1 MAG: 50S ribosomal protein L10 [Thermoplasmata archaeon]
MAHVAEWKFKEVEDLTKIIKDNSVIGIAEIGSIPAPQMQQMRENLREKMVIRSSKNTLIFRAIDDAEKKVKDITALKEIVTGQTALIATDLNPFQLFNKLKETRSKAPARGGEIAPEDIIVKKGDTPFKPGPIVGDLQKVGIPASIQGGKVVIKKDKVLVKEGEIISSDIAQMITRLEIYPIEIGISLNGCYEDGFIFKPDVLDIDMDQYMSQVRLAASSAFNLAVETAWVNKLTVKPLIMKAYRDSFNVAVDQGIINKETVKQIIAKAHRSMVSVASNVKDEGLDDDLKEMT